MVNNLAWIMCEHEGQYEEALELAQQGLKVSPEYADLIDTRGVIYYRSGEYQKAVEDFIESDPAFDAGKGSGELSNRFSISRQALPVVSRGNVFLQPPHPMQTGRCRAKGQPVLAKVLGTPSYGVHPRDL